MRFVGVDAGGSSVRAVTCDETGRLLGFGRAAGANLRSSLGDPTTHLFEALAAALRGDRQVDAVAVGAAGAGPGTRDQVAAVLADVVARLEVGIEPLLVEDSVAAFRAVSPTAEGVLILAGTGCNVQRFERWHPVTSVDGIGWLLGDAGSGVWLGRRVLRAVAAALDGRGPMTALLAPTLAQFGVASGPGALRALIAATDGSRPSTWAALAPAAVALDGVDAVATDLLDRAAAHLLHSAAVAGARQGQPVVTAGGLAGTPSLQRRMLLTHPDSPHARHPVVGACALAAASLGIDLPRERLTRALDSV